MKTERKKEKRGGGRWILSSGEREGAQPESVTRGRDGLG